MYGAIDVAVNRRHKDLQGLGESGPRVAFGFDAIDSVPLMTDPHGHGTYMAALVGGNRYGM